MRDTVLRCLDNMHFIREGLTDFAKGSQRLINDDVTVTAAHSQASGIGLTCLQHACESYNNMAVCDSQLVHTQNDDGKCLLIALK